jgi:hypothetical protein
MTQELDLTAVNVPDVDRRDSKHEYNFCLDRDIQRRLLSLDDGDGADDVSPSGTQPCQGVINTDSVILKIKYNMKRPQGRQVVIVLLLLPMTPDMTLQLDGLEQHLWIGLNDIKFH